MGIGSKTRWAMVVGALAISAPMLAGCPKKEETTSSATGDKDKEKDKKGAKSEKGKGDDDEEKEKGSGYEALSVLKHVPKECGVARVFVNLGGLATMEGTKASFAKLDDKLAESVKGKDGKKMKAVLKIFEKENIDPFKDVREIAFCMDDKGTPIVAVGGDFDGKDVLGAIKKSAEEEGEKDLESSKEEGIEMLHDKKGALAKLSSTVYGFGKDPETIAKYKKEKDQSGAWSVKEGALAVVHFTEKGNEVDAWITDKDDEMEVKISAEVTGKDGEAMKDDPDAFKKELKKIIAQGTSKLEGTPLAKIADDVKNAKITIDGKKLTIVAKIPQKDLASTLKKLMDASPEELQGMFK
jgi:hypothetical protein